LLVNPLINGSIDTGREYLLKLPCVKNSKHKEIISEGLKVFGRAGARGAQQYLKMSLEGRMSPEDQYAILIFIIASALKETLGAANQYSVKEENWLSSKEGLAVIYQDIFFQELTKRRNEKIEQKETYEAEKSSSNAITEKDLLDIKIALLNDQIADLSFLVNSAKNIDNFMHNNNNLKYTNMEGGTELGALERLLRTPAELDAAVRFWAKSRTPPTQMENHILNTANAAAVHELLITPSIAAQRGVFGSSASSSIPQGEIKNRPSVSSASSSDTPQGEIKNRPSARTS